MSRRICSYTVSCTVYKRILFYNRSLLKIACQIFVYLLMVLPGLIAILHDTMLEVDVTTAFHLAL